jgi:hypothetical protein
MLKVLQRLPFRLFSSKDAADPAVPPPSQPKHIEYLLFPTAFPVSPYYFYSTRINKHLYEFIQKNNIRYVAALPIRPGVYRRDFFPHSREDL